MRGSCGPNPLFKRTSAVVVPKQTLRCALSFPRSPLSLAGPGRVAVAAAPTPCSHPRAAPQVHGHNGGADLWAVPSVPSPCQQSLFPTALPSRDHASFVAGWPLLALVSGRRKITKIIPSKQKPKKAASMAAVPKTLESGLPAHPCGVANCTAESGRSLCLAATCCSLPLLMVLLWLGRWQYLSHQHTSHPHFTPTECHSLSCQEKPFRPIQCIRPIKCLLSSKLHQKRQGWHWPCLSSLPTWASFTNWLEILSQTDMGLLWATSPPALGMERVHSHVIKEGRGKTDTTLSWPFGRNLGL